MAIYHYTNLTTLIEYILPTKTLKSSSFSNMNDPRESNPWSMGSINLPYEKIFPEYYSDKTHIDCQYKFGQIIKERFQIICFSGAQQKGWDNEMMWSHYADNQKGVCLEFDEDLLMVEAKKMLPNVDILLKEVNYITKKKEKPWVNWNNILSIEENINNYASILSQKVIFHKSHFWEKEDEKRLLFLNYVENVFLPYGQSLTAIHIGLGFPRAYLPAIESLIEGTSIKLYTMIYERDKYIRWNLTRKDGDWFTSIDKS
ncbi:hypothetical protein HNQ02_000641 [Flavobacterium sp. 7E]|uniref:DUF2971 domain-containing protein n=1 Tax=Flavobacterium sp. 7E TaxID=2735898 RepID=UPI00156D8C93|nr:DUF2971 domain-containing protein [Flavobacterium sp. 7E]NRS87734.1 hypothetical protein [Flavobacterium sp. 7E]